MVCVLGGVIETRAAMLLGQAEDLYALAIVWGHPHVVVFKAYQ